MDKPESGILIEELVELKLFRGESPEAIEWLLKAAAVKKLSRGYVLIAPEKPSEALYILLAGRLKAMRGKAGNDIYLEAGECVGEMSPLNEQHPDATVIAEEDCRLLVIGHQILWPLISHSHVFSRNLLFMLSEQHLGGKESPAGPSFMQKFVHDHQAQYDALTGVHNRLWLDGNLNRIVERSIRGNSPLSVLLIDIDYLSKYNEKYGHIGGDLVLSTVSKTIQQHLRPDDVVARFGGEEFLAILIDTSMENAQVVANRLLTAIREQPIVQMNGASLPETTVSIGMSGLSSNRDVLLEDVKKALAQAKRNGRDRIEKI